MSTDAVRYKLMRLLETDPALSQRELARRLGVSVSKVNYCLRALTRKGWVKATSFKSSQKKSAYMYLPTSSGFENKTTLALKLLHIKMREHETLRQEIEQVLRDPRDLRH